MCDSFSGLPAAMMLAWPNSTTLKSATVTTCTPVGSVALSDRRLGLS